MDTPLCAGSWAEVGHRIAPLMRELIERATHFLALSTPGDGYVQVIGYARGQCFAEADSGEWTDTQYSDAQHRHLRELGWRHPGERDPRPENANYWVDYEEQVDLYALVLLLLRTMAEVFQAQPEDVAVQFELRDSAAESE